MVTVRKLRAILKKMPQNMQVGVAMHDNGPNEVAGLVMSVSIQTDNDFETGELGEKCVVLQC